MHFHVGSNMPGYLPEDDVSVVVDPEDALAVWREDVTRALDAIEDDHTCAALNAQLNATTVESLPSGVLLPVNHYVYWITPCFESGPDHVADPV